MIDCEFETNTGESIDSLTPQIIFLCMTIPFNWSGAGDRHMPSSGSLLLSAYRPLLELIHSAMAAQFPHALRKREG